MRFLLLSLMLSGCAYAVRATGSLQREGDALIVASTNGKSRPLELNGPSAALARLDGYTVELEGVTHKGAIRVTSWRVLEGLHGMSVWVGSVARTEHGIALDDAENHVRLTLKGDGADVLWDEIGRAVLIEGFIDGTLQVQVVDSIPLDGP